VLLAKTTHNVLLGMHATKHVLRFQTTVAAIHPVQLANIVITHSSVQPFQTIAPPTHHAPMEAFVQAICARSSQAIAFRIVHAVQVLTAPIVSVLLFLTTARTHKHVPQDPTVQIVYVLGYMGIVHLTTHAQLVTIVPILAIAPWPATTVTLITVVQLELIVITAYANPFLTIV
jgi:hypothetical protein